jgi:beta-galactosidase
MTDTLLRLPAGLALALALAHGAVIVDASKVADPPATLPFATGGRSPDGRVLAINSRYLSLDGQPWFPVMGEFQYSRYPTAGWERELLKMKAGGIRIVSTYVFWIHHEEIEGQFDWSGQRDLRRFVELAGRHGLFVWVRVGPWNHGEARNGGLPDWLLKKSATRANDPAYLASVRRFYGEIGRQLKGFFWEDGGPIVGVQIENEYHERGPGKGEEHILTLRKMAVEAGLNAPFYTVTGWDDAAVPSREVLPVFGGYPDGFWYRSRTPLPPSPMYFFSTIRRDEDVGDDLCSKRPDLDTRQASYPFLTAEMAGGMELSYHRRPIMSADDIAALDVVKLGSGVTLYGYYMFHGGANPDGRETTLQESQATGYPNDLPLKAYDFQAPLGEFGQMHPSFRDLKSIHLFLHDFGSTLAPMTAFFPKEMPRSKADLDTPRVAVRAGAKSAFLFLNNYQKDHPLPERKDLQVEVQLATGTVTVPRLPVKLPSGTYTFWPVDLPVGGSVLEYATAQPLCKLDDPDTVLFFAWPGVTPEFAFREADGVSIEAPQARVQRENGRVYIAGLNPGLGTTIRIRSRDGHVTTVLLLTREQARNVWKAPLAGRQRLIYSAADLYFEGDRVHLGSADPAGLAFGVYPDLDREVAGFQHLGPEGIFAGYAARVEPVAAAAVVRQTAQAGRVAPVKLGPEVATTPAESAFKAAARWSIRVPDVKSAAVGEILLRLTYQGDVARLYAGGRLITDDFYHGTPWEIGLRNIPAEDLAKGLTLEILPLRQDAPIYLAAGARPSLPHGGQVAKLAKVQILAQYQAVADLTLGNPTLGGFH